MLDAFKSVPGHLYEHEGECLQQLAKGLRVLEFGTHHGRSAIAMAATARFVDTIDTYRGDYMIGAPDIEKTRANIMGSKMRNIMMNGMSWQEFIMMLSYNGTWHAGYDMVFYDAAHDQEGAFLGFCEGFKGVIALHDYKPHEPAMEHVVRNVNEFAQRTRREMKGPVGSVVWFDSLTIGI